MNPVTARQLFQAGYDIQQQIRSQFPEPEWTGDVYSSRERGDFPIPAPHAITFGGVVDVPSEMEMSHAHLEFTVSDDSVKDMLAQPSAELLRDIPAGFDLQMTTMSEERMKHIMIFAYRA